MENRFIMISRYTPVVFVCMVIYEEKKFHYSCRDCKVKDPKQPRNHSCRSPLGLTSQGSTPSITILGLMMIIIISILYTILFSVLRQCVQMQYPQQPSNHHLKQTNLYPSEPNTRLNNGQTIRMSLRVFFYKLQLSCIKQIVCLTMKSLSLRDSSEFKRINCSMILVIPRIFYIFPKMFCQHLSNLYLSASNNTETATQGFGQVDVHRDSTALLFFLQVAKTVIQGN